MKVDIARQLGATSRVVRNLERDGRPAYAIVATRSYDTSIDDLWDAITRAERIPRWFLPVSGALQLGGRFQLEGNAAGTIERCEPPHTLALTWEFAETVSWVTVSLSPDGAGRTRLDLEHLAHVDDHWHTFGPGAGGVGWDGALMGLDQYARAGVTVTPEEAMAWMTSEEGRAFYRGSSVAWEEAHLASGADPAAAAAAAARTAAFYTGEGS